jgi:hypothetical protein
MPIHHEVAAMQRLTVQQLRARYAEVYGEGTSASNRVWLIKRMAWRLQALADGYAPRFVTKESKAIEATMKELKKGDIVTIKYTTDFERRRLETLEKKEKE